MTKINATNDYTTLNYNITKAVATADADLNIISCRTNFRRFLGAKNEYRNLYDIIDLQHVNSLKQQISELKVNSSTIFVTNMVRVDNEKRKVILKIYLSENNFYTIELLDLHNINDYVYTLELRALKYKKILESFGSLFFEFNTKTKYISIFSLKSTIEENIINCPIEQLKDTINVVPEDIEVYNNFYYALLNCEHYFEYIFSKNPFSDSDNPIIINGHSIITSEETPYIVGSINKYSLEYENSGFISNTKNIDMMTGLLTKNAVLDYARAAIDQKKFNQVFLIMVDLDNFKMVNDNYGHMFGDEVIKTISGILKANIAGNGCVGRFGGDEFFICVHDLGSEGDLRAILGTIFNNIENAYKNKLQGFNLSASVGISEYPRNGDNFNLLFKKADRAVYIAKKKGKKRYIIYKEHLHGDIDLNTENDDYILQLDTQKYAGDIKCFEVVKNSIADLAINGISHLDDTMNKLIATYGLTGISIYIGKDFSLKKQWGSYSNPMANADYMTGKIGIKRFNQKCIFAENNVRVNGFYVPVIHDKLNSHSIGATVQCIIGSLDNIKGLVTFDIEHDTRNWTEEDIDYFGIIAQLVGQWII